MPKVRTTSAPKSRLSSRRSWRRAEQVRNPRGPVAIAVHVDSDPVGVMQSIADDHLEEARRPVGGDESRIAAVPEELHGTLEVVHVRPADERAVVVAGEDVAHSAAELRSNALDFREVAVERIR